MDEAFRGRREPLRKSSHLAHKPVRSNAKHYMLNASDERIQEMASNIEVIEETDVEGRPI